MLNLLNANATGNITGSWLTWAGHRLGIQRAHFYIAGTHGGATYTLRWRPTGSSDSGMIIAEYTNVTTDVMLSVDVAPGEVQVQVAGGSSVNSMPRLVY